MVGKSLKLFIPILSLIYLHVYGNVLFEVKEVPKAEWLGSLNSKIILRSPVECAIHCNKMYDLDMSCNSIMFDESDNTCSLAWYLRMPEGEPGLRVAWASSVYHNNVPWFAIDKQIGDIFFSTRDRVDYPWLAIDLVRPEKVGKVEIKSRSGFETRTHDIEVRVGYEKPFARDTNGDTLYTTNTVCGYLVGPASSGSDFIIECSSAIEGRYITVQRVKANTEHLNFVEFLLETEPIDTKMIETIKVFERPSRNGQCGKEYPFAYEGGSRCCETGFDDPIGLDGKRRNGFLNFDSKGCKGESRPCPLGCMNYNYQRYWCHAYNKVGTTNTEDIDPKAKSSTWKECEDYAKSKKAVGWIWHENGYCFPKKGDFTLDFADKPVKVAGLIPCP